MPATLPGLTLLGATLALRMRGRPLLLVWSVAYMPALFSMLLVVAGANAIRTGLDNGFGSWWRDQPYPDHWCFGGHAESTRMKFFLPPLIRRTVRARFLGNFVLLFGLLFLLGTSIDTLLTFHEYLGSDLGRGGATVCSGLRFCD